MAITTLPEFREYIRNRLGGGTIGVINVELSVDHLNQSVEDAIQIFQRYNYGEAVHEDYMTLSLTAGVSAYYLSGADVTDVVDFSLSMSSQNSITNLFSPANMVLGGGQIGIMNGDGAGMSLTNYQIAMNYLETLSEIFGVKHRIDYIELQEKLIVTPTPSTDMVALIKVYKRENTVRLYNHILVKKLAVALSKQVWGLILSKYTGIPLPGGGDVGQFGSSLMEKGEKEQEEIEKKMTNEGESNMFFMIG